MFSLPSVWNLIVSTIVFSIAAKYIHSHLHSRGIPNSRKRYLWVLGLASLLSWGAGEAADWAHDQIEGQQPALQNAAVISNLPQIKDQIKN